MSAPNLISPTTLSGGTPVGGSGTSSPSTIPRWTGASTLGDSIIIQGSTANAIGIGNAPTTDLAGYKALEVGGLGSGFVNADNDLWITANAKHSGGGWKYAVAASTPSNSIRANAGAIIFNRAGNGTAGNALTWLESARIDSSGNVGIGEPSPTTRLQVQGIANTTAFYVVGSSTVGQSYGALISAGTNASDRSFAVFNSGNTSTYLFVRGDGNVGIGTASPNKKFQVLDGATGEVRFTTTANVVGNTITQRFSSNAGAGAYEGGGAYIQAIQGSGIDVWSLAFGTANLSATATEVMRLSSAGVMTMANNGAAANPIIANSTGVSGMYFPSATTVAIAANGAVAATFSKVAGAGVALGGTTGLVFDASGSQQGIKLRATPDSLDSQTLDCYQDGGAANSGGVTWTPTLAFGGNSTGITYTTQVGRYTRIGNTIVAHAYIKISSKGTSTGDATIGGLPTSSNTTGVYPSAAIGFTASITFANQMFARMNPNSTSVFLTETTGAGTVSALNDTDFNNSSEIAFTICYPVT